MHWLKLVSGESVNIALAIRIVTRSGTLEITFANGTTMVLKDPADVSASPRSSLMGNWIKGAIKHPGALH